MNTLKKTICIVALASLSCFFSPSAKSWGDLGHATVAKIAQDHLTPKARKALKKYLGVPLPAIASDADADRSVWTMDLGFVPTNPDDARVAFLKEFDWVAQGIADCSAEDAAPDGIQMDLFFFHPFEGAIRFFLILISVEMGEVPVEFVEVVHFL